MRTDLITSCCNIDVTVCIAQRQIKIREADRKISRKIIGRPPEDRRKITRKRLQNGTSGCCLFVFSVQIFADHMDLDEIRRLFSGRNACNENDSVAVRDVSGVA